MWTKSDNNKDSKSEARKQAEKDLLEQGFSQEKIDAITRQTRRISELEEETFKQAARELIGEMTLGRGLIINKSDVSLASLATKINQIYETWIESGNKDSHAVIKVVSILLGKVWADETIKETVEVLNGKE